MDESTHPPGAADRPRQFGYCAWHKGHTDGVRLVQLADQGSGPGGHGLHACAPCRTTYRLVPLAEQPAP